MAKATKAVKTPKAAKTTKAAEVPAKVEAPVQPVTQVASVATKLTKRSDVVVSDKLVATEKAPRSRAEHVKNAWEAVTKALPATAAELAKLPELGHEKCVSPQAFISYMIRRGHLKPVKV